MPEYKRFIAYFYEYIDGKKQKSAGFAKVELRNGIWRILFRLTAGGTPVPPVKVYGFVREKDRLLGTLHGKHPAGEKRGRRNGRIRLEKRCGEISILFPICQESGFRAETGEASSQCGTMKP